MKREACPSCKTVKRVIKRGFYTRKSDGKIIQKFSCNTCSLYFSAQTYEPDYRLRKRYINQSVFRMLCKGVSQRACALILRVRPAAIARRLKLFSNVAKRNLEKYRKQIKVSEIMFDEMESFEHSKCKPVTIPIAVEKHSRKILAVATGQIAAKGHLAAISRKKYGPRTCERKQSLEKLCKQIKECINEKTEFHCDKNPSYKSLIQKRFPGNSIQQYKGRKGCIVGQGELKEGSIDPLFDLNHSFAMIRDNVKRLTRRTWCTTKKKENLELFVNMYAWFHKLYLDKEKLSIACF